MAAPTDAQLSALLDNQLEAADAMALLGQLTLEHLANDAQLADTLARLATLLRARAQAVPPVDATVLDTCGTGGSGLVHFNTSTAAAFVLAAAGVPVIKFGNRSATGRSGSFDFLEALGLPAEQPLAAISDRLAKNGLVFLFAPQVYPSLKPLAALRSRFGRRTLFNVVGPLLNPYMPAYRLLGCSHPRLLAPIAHTLAHMSGHQQSWVVCGHYRGTACLDEVAIAEPTQLVPVSGSVVEATRTLPAEGPALPGVTELALSPQDNARLFQAMITGEDTHSAWFRLVCRNAGAALAIAGRVNDLTAGEAMAEALFADGAVAAQLEKVRAQ